MNSGRPKPNRDIVERAGAELPNPFEFLGIPERLVRSLSEASLRKLVAAMVKALSAIYHPDGAVYSDRSENNFRRVQEAGEILAKNPELFELWKMQAMAMGRREETGMAKRLNTLRDKLERSTGRANRLGSEIYGLERILTAHCIDRFGYASNTLHLPPDSLFLSELPGAILTVGMKKRELVVAEGLALMDPENAATGMQLLGSLAASRGGAKALKCLAENFESACAPFVFPRRMKPHKNGSTLVVRKGEGEPRLLGELLDIRFPKGKEPRVEKRREVLAANRLKNPQ